MTEVETSRRKEREWATEGVGGKARKSQARRGHTVMLIFVHSCLVKSKCGTAYLNFSIAAAILKNVARL